MCPPLTQMCSWDPLTIRVKSHPFFVIFAWFVTVKLHEGSCPALVSTHLSRSPVETLLLLMARSPARLCLLLRLLATCSPCREDRSDIDLEWTKPEQRRRMRGFSDKGCFVSSILSFYSPISKWVLRAYKHTRIILGWAFRCQWFENPKSFQITTA